VNKDDIEKRMNAVVDILTFLNERIEQQVAQQVEHQVEKRLEREREYWRGVLANLIVKEVGDFVKEVGELVRTSHDEMINRVQQIEGGTHAEAGIRQASRRECRIAFRCGGAGAAADVPFGLVVSVYSRCFF
jgi:hypothetical protein